MKPFKLISPFVPTGDQPQAIDKIIENFQSGRKNQILLGVTGSGKTFTAASVIERLQRPTLVMAHNKTLAAQLFSEFREFFPENSVQYFVSYYDYYQPEAYLPMTDTYIEKDSSINQEIEKFRHASTHSILTRRDTIIVASVSCIYGLGSPEVYKQGGIVLKKGECIPRLLLTRRLAEIQYERNDFDLSRGRYRVQGDTILIYPAYEDYQLKITQFGDEIESLQMVDPLTHEVIDTLPEIEIFPARHYLTPEIARLDILKQIEEDMRQEVAQFTKDGKLLEAQRLKQRVSFDLEMIKETGITSGIENYSRYFDQRAPGTPPSVLLDYFPPDFLLMVDESHITIPQVGGMYNGDKARKQTLVEYGFRLKAAMDNRPLKFAEFEERQGQTLYISATPGKYELEKATQEEQDIRVKTGKKARLVVEQLVRPTGIIDPEVEVRPVEGQIDNLMEEISARVKKGQRVLVTTLTKRMAEDITEFLQERGMKVQYLHSDIKTIERTEILQDLRRGTYDVVVGINLLREGLDLPEVSLVAILDADKEGFLRSETSLIQTIGRATRHLEGMVIMYADRMTGSMQRAIEETNRRRKVQQEYNLKHGITPASLNKPITIALPVAAETDGEMSKIGFQRLSRPDKIMYLEELREKMQQAALNLDFEGAAKVRDQIKLLQS